MKHQCSVAAAAAATVLALLGLPLSQAQNTTRGLIGNDALGEWHAAYDKAKAFASTLDLRQKATVVTGGNVTSSTLGFFPGLVISDGQAGVSMSYFVTGWGEPAAVAMSWDKEAIYNQAKAIGVEFKLRGAHVCDGPTSSPLGRTAWGGRMAETFGFDSYLNGIAFGLSAQAELDAGVIPSGKHFLLYEQETNRTTGYNVVIDDKSLHETYLAPWYDAVKGGIGASMCAMNAVNGGFSCESEPLLMGLLKEEVGFPGFVVPDINGQRTLNGSANGGLDWASDQKWNVSNVMGLVTSGQVSQARLDDMVIRNLIGWYRIGADDGKFPPKAASGDYRPSPALAAHRQMVRENGAKSMALLKNTGKALPLRQPRTLTVFGAHAGPSLYGPNEAFQVSGVASSVYQGHLVTSGGAGSAPLPYSVTPLQALTERAASDGTQLRWILNDTFTGGSTGFVAAGASTGVTPSIRNYAQFSEACLVFLNAWGGEGRDRTELRNAAQDQLVAAVAAECNSTVVVVNTVGPRILDAWIEHPNVTAVLYGFPLGQESGHAVVDVLYGDVNPSAALTHTIARREDDYPARPCLTRDCDFSEGNYIDYKHFDRAAIEPRFPFGHGLSYTTFAYSGLQISTGTGNATGIKAGPATGLRSVGGRADLWDELVAVQLAVANTGDTDGSHTVQLYLTFPASADQPVRQLRGFEKVEVSKGGSAAVQIKLRRRDISYWDIGAQEWVVATGEYTANLGASSRDLRLKGTFRV